MEKVGSGWRVLAGWGTLALLLTCCGPLGRFPSFSKACLPFQSGTVKDQFHRVTVRLSDVCKVLNAWRVLLNAQ